MFAQIDKIGYCYLCCRFDIIILTKNIFSQQTVLGGEKLWQQMQREKF